MEAWPQLKKLEDGDSLNAETLNVPITELGQRTDYLLRRLRNLGGAKSSLVLTDVPLSEDDTPIVGNVVYFDNNSLAFVKARASMSLLDDFTADESAFTVGVVVATEGATGDVLVYGQLDLNTGSAIPKSDLLETDEKFRSGRYYLSGREAGKITAYPNGPLVYIGSFQSNGDDSEAFTSSSVAYINPQFLDMGTSHKHRSHVLVARPAGDVDADGKTVLGFLAETPAVSDDSSSSGELHYISPSLSFGGVWTADSDVVYRFFFNNASEKWGEVSLCWTENGESHIKKVSIPAPGVEVDVSNGLRVSVNFPDADSTYAFRDLDEGARTWAPMTFPDAGRGWINHSVKVVATDASASSSSDSYSEPEVRALVDGVFRDMESTVYVAFPAKIGMHTFDNIEAGTTFDYAGTTYEFVNDVNTATTGRKAVQLGSTVHDSILYLAKAITEVSGHTALAFSYDPDTGSSSESLEQLVILDGDTDSWADGRSTTATAFQVIGDENDPGDGEIPFIVAYDDAGEIHSASDVPYIEHARTYKRHSFGNFSVSVYQDFGMDETVVELGTVLSAAVFDDEGSAKYDYVLGMDPEINTFWPPIPAKSASLVVNGVEMGNKAHFPDSPTISFGAKTIHWFENAYAYTPWPKGATSRTSVVDPSEDKAMVVYWLRGFQCAQGPVTSLSVKTGSPLKIQTYGTDSDANTGDLWIGADIDFAVKGAGIAGYNAVKTGRHGNLLAGPVVEKILAGPGVRIMTKAGCPEGQGTLTIGFDSLLRGSFDIKLENAKEQALGMFPYIQLPGYVTTLNNSYAFTATLEIPPHLADGSYRLRLHAPVFGEASFSNEEDVRYAGLELNYNILATFTDDEYKNLKQGLMAPDSTRIVNLPFGHVGGDGTYSYSAFDPMILATEAAADDPWHTPIPDIVSEGLGPAIPAASEFSDQSVIPDLRPGYLVAIRISRTVNTTGTPYTGAVGFLGLQWSLAMA